MALPQHAAPASDDANAASTCASIASSDPILRLVADEGQRAVREEEQAVLSFITGGVAGAPASSSFAVAATREFLLSIGSGSRMDPGLPPVVPVPPPHLVTNLYPSSRITKIGIILELLHWKVRALIERVEL